MAEQTTIPVPRARARARRHGGGETRRRRVRRRPALHWWLGAAVALLAVSAAIVIVTDMRPGYDAFGWLVWGHQVLHWNLNTDGAPSWKPMPFLFTLPYALLGKGQMSMWNVTAVAGALAGGVFGARIAHRLTGRSPGRRLAPWVAAALAGVGVLGISGYAHQVLIANSDPIVVGVCLAAIDSHLSRRFRLALGLLVLASLGRPEVWPFAVGYAGWAWRSVPRARVLAVAGVALIPILWFSVPALTSKSWFTPGDLALSSVNPVNIIHGNRILGVLNRLRELYESSMQVAVLVAVAVAGLARDRRLLALTGLAAVWVAIEIGFALHGWSAAARYLFEPAAVMVVVTAGAVGRVLAWAPGPRPLPVRVRAVGWIGPVAVAGLLVALVPVAGTRVNDTHDDLSMARATGRQIDRLQAVIAQDGGARRIEACGQPVTLVGNQSAVAWAVGLNVGNVGYTPGRSIRRGTPIVVFKPHQHGWQVRPFNVAKPDTDDCESLRLDSDFG